MPINEDQGAPNLIERISEQWTLLRDIAVFEHLATAKDPELRDVILNKLLLDVAEGSTSSTYLKDEFYCVLINLYQRSHNEWRVCAKVAEIFAQALPSASVSLLDMDETGVKPKEELYKETAPVKPETVLRMLQDVCIVGLRRNVTQQSFKGALLHCATRCWSVLGNEEVPQASQRTMVNLLRSIVADCAENYQQQGGSTIIQVFSSLMNIIDTVRELIHACYDLATHALSPEFDAKFGRKSHKATICRLLGHCSGDVLEIVNEQADTGVPALIANCLSCLQSQSDITDSVCQSVMSCYNLLHTLFTYEHVSHPLKGSIVSEVTKYLLNGIEATALKDDDLSMAKCYCFIDLAGALNPAAENSESSVSRIETILDYHLSDYTDKARSNASVSSWVIIRFVNTYIHHLKRQQVRLSMSTCNSLLLLLISVKDANACFVLRRLIDLARETWGFESIGDMLLIIFLFHQDVRIFKAFTDNPLFYTTDMLSVRQRWKYSGIVNTPMEYVEQVEYVKQLGFAVASTYKILKEVIHGVDLDMESTFEHSDLQTQVLTHTASSQVVTQLTMASQTQQSQGSTQDAVSALARLTSTMLKEGRTREDLEAFRDTVINVVSGIRVEEHILEKEANSRPICLSCHLVEVFWISALQQLLDDSGLSEFLPCSYEVRKCDCHTAMAAYHALISERVIPKLRHSKLSVEGQYEEELKSGDRGEPTENMLYPMEERLLFIHIAYNPSFDLDDVHLEERLHLNELVGVLLYRCRFTNPYSDYKGLVKRIRSFSISNMISFPFETKQLLRLLDFFSWHYEDLDGKRLSGDLRVWFGDDKLLREQWAVAAGVDEIKHRVNNLTLQSTNNVHHHHATHRTWRRRLIDQNSLMDGLMAEDIVLDVTFVEKLSHEITEALKLAHEEATSTNMSYLDTATPVSSTIVVRSILSLLRLANKFNYVPPKDLQDIVKKIISKQFRLGSSDRFSVLLTMALIKLKQFKQKVQLLKLGGKCFTVDQFLEWINMAHENGYVDYRLDIQDNSADATPGVLVLSPELIDLPDISNLLPIAPLLVLKLLTRYRANTDFKYWNSVNISRWWSLMKAASAAAGISDSSLEPRPNYPFRDHSASSFGKWQCVLKKYVSNTARQACTCRSTICALMQKDAISVDQSAILTVFFDIVRGHLSDYKIRTRHLVRYVTESADVDERVVKHAISMVFDEHKSSNVRYQKKLLGWILANNKQSYLQCSSSITKRHAVENSLTPTIVAIVDIVMFPVDNQQALPHVDTDEIANVVLQGENRPVNTRLMRDLQLLRFICDNLQYLMELPGIPKLLQIPFLLRGSHGSANTPWQLGTDRKKVCLPDLEHATRGRLTTVQQTLDDLFALSGISDEVDCSPFTWNIWKQCTSSSSLNLGDLCILPYAYRALTTPEGCPAQLGEDESSELGWGDRQALIAEQLMVKYWPDFLELSESSVNEFANCSKKLTPSSAASLTSQLAKLSVLIGLIQISVCRLGKAGLTNMQVKLASNQSGTTSAYIIKILAGILARFKFPATDALHYELPLSIRSLLEKQSSETESIPVSGLVKPPGAVSLSEFSELILIVVAHCRLQTAASSAYCRLYELLVSVLTITQTKSWSFIKKWCIPYVNQYLACSILPVMRLYDKGPNQFRSLSIDTTAAPHFADSVWSPHETRSPHVWAPRFTLAPFRYASRVQEAEDKPAELTASSDDSIKPTASQHPMTIDVSSFSQEAGHESSINEEETSRRRGKTIRATVSDSIEPICRLWLTGGSSANRLRPVKGYFPSCSFFFSNLLLSLESKEENVEEAIKELIASVDGESQATVLDKAESNSYVGQLATILQSSMSALFKAINTLVVVYGHMIGMTEGTKQFTFVSKLSLSFRARSLLDGLVLSKRYSLMKHLPLVNSLFEKSNYFSSYLRYLLLSPETGDEKGQFDFADVAKLLLITIRIVPSSDSATQNKNMHCITSFITRTFPLAPQLNEALLQPIIHLCYKLITLKIEGTGANLFSCGVGCLAAILQGIHASKGAEFAKAAVIPTSPLYIPDAILKLLITRLPIVDLRDCRRSGIVVAKALALHPVRPLIVRQIKDMLSSLLNSSEITDQSGNTTQIKRGVLRACLIYQQLLINYPAIFGEEEQTEFGLSMLVASCMDTLTAASIRDSSVLEGNAQSNVMVQNALLVVYCILQVWVEYEVAYSSDIGYNEYVRQTHVLSDEALETQQVYSIRTIFERYLNQMDLAALMQIPEIQFKGYYADRNSLTFKQLLMLVFSLRAKLGYELPTDDSFILGILNPQVRLY